MRETEKGWVVDAELPGMNKEDIKIHVEGQRLSIEGESRREESSQKEAQDKEQWSHVERQYGRFYRSIQLPSQCDMQGIQARHENGILHLEIPKLPDDQVPGRRQVQIQ